jgi:cation-transporting ATPase E
MKNFFIIFKLIFKNFKPVAFHNIVSLVNLLFFIVTLVLVFFKEFRDALFLAAVLVLNIVIGIIQDLRAKVALEQLQLIMAPKIIRMNGLVEETISLDEVQVGDTIKISLGDQVPADGKLLKSLQLEINEALLTGESENRTKLQGDEMLAGSIVTAGSGLLRVEVVPHESFIARTTDKIKKYSINLSPIQKTLNQFIKYMTYILLVIVGYVLVHGLTAHELLVSIVKDIAALTGTLVPQGLILATTIFFAYGALRLFKQQVLLQEINATEKLGRIKNLCIDKTGTLTENSPVFEQVILCGDQEESKIMTLVQGYVEATHDHSETIKSLLAKAKPTFKGAVIASLPFSSIRKYGGATLELGTKRVTMIIGAPDILLNFISNPQEQEWVSQIIAKHATQAKRLVLITQTATSTENLLPTLEGFDLHPIAIGVLYNPLRPGTREVIDFFQTRGVRIRVISGDNPHTVQAIAHEAGIKHIDILTTGAEIERWDEEEFEERVPAFHLFARITPDQKERIVARLQRSSFTAMVGDGANDALAIKKADLGIAMFNGANATRQIAQIVLMNNSFAALPKGIRMAETIITNIELVASIFFNRVITGLLLFMGLAFFRYTFPISPRNITLINYCVIFFPLLYWTIFPAHKEGGLTGQSFLRRIVPFSAVMATLTALAVVSLFLFGTNELRVTQSNSYVVFILITLGYWFFVLAPQAYGIAVTNKHKKTLYTFAIIIIGFLALVMLNPVLSSFFDLRPPDLVSGGVTLGVIVLFATLQYWITRRWFSKSK